MKKPTRRDRIKNSSTFFQWFARIDWSYSIGDLQWGVSLKKKKRWKDGFISSAPIASACSTPGSDTLFFRITHSIASEPFPHPPRRWDLTLFYFYFFFNRLGINSVFLITISRIVFDWRIVEWMMILCDVGMEDDPALFDVLLFLFFR